MHNELLKLWGFLFEPGPHWPGRVLPNCQDLYQGFYKGAATYVANHPLPTDWPPFDDVADRWLRRVVAWRWQNPDWPNHERVLRGIAADVAAALAAINPSVTKELKMRLFSVVESRLATPVAVAWARLNADAEGFSELVSQFNLDQSQTLTVLTLALIDDSFPGTGQSLGRASLDAWVREGWRLGPDRFLGWVVYRVVDSTRPLFAGIKTGGLVAGLLVRYLNQNHGAGIKLIDVIWVQCPNGNVKALKLILRCATCGDGPSRILAGPVCAGCGQPYACPQCGQPVDLAAWRCGCPPVSTSAGHLNVACPCCGKRVDLSTHRLVEKRWLVATHGPAAYIRLDRASEAVYKCLPEGHYVPGEWTTCPLQPPPPGHRISRSPSTVHVAYALPPAPAPTRPPTSTAMAIAAFVASLPSPHWRSWIDDIFRQRLGGQAAAPLSSQDYDWLDAALRREASKTGLTGPQHVQRLGDGISQVFAQRLDKMDRASFESCFSALLVAAFPTVAKIAHFLDGKPDWVWAALGRVIGRDGSEWTTDDYLFLDAVLRDLRARIQERHGDDWAAAARQDGLLALIAERFKLHGYLLGRKIADVNPDRQMFLLDLADVLERYW